MFVCVLRHAEKTWKKPVCGFKNVSVFTFKTSPCMPAPRAFVFQLVRVVPVHTEGDLYIHTGGTGSSLVLLTKICPRRFIKCFRGSLSV